MKLKYIYTLLICTVGFSSIAQLDRSKVPTAQPNPGINIPQPNVFTLENGLQVIVVENHKQPKVSFQLYVDHAPVTEKNKAGVSSLFGELLGSGTSTTSKDKFDEKIDFMGASFSSSSRGFFASSLTKHSANLLNLLSGVVTSPAFPESEFERLKNQTISGLAATNSDPSAMAKNVAGVVNYGDNHPYGEVVTEKTINAIKLDDIKNHYNKYFKPNISYLVVVGDITAAKAKEYAETYFGKWNKGNIEKQKQVHVDMPTSTQVYFVDKPGAVQSVIHITQPVKLKPGHEDEIKLRVLNAILGGGSFSARLMANLREDKAYTYGCYSRISSDELIGSFYAGGSFRNEVTDSAVTQILKEIKLITEEIVLDKEIDLVKKSMTGAFARSLENPQTIARFALNTIRYNLPANYYSTYLQKLERVKKSDLFYVASEYLSPNKLNIIVVGNSEIAPKLNQFDSDGKLTFKDGFGKDVVKLKSVATDVTAKSVINTFMLKSFIAEDQNTIDAKTKKIGYIKGVSTSFIAQMNAELTLTTYKAKPNKSAMTIVAGEMTVQKEWFNGEEGGNFVMMQGDTKFTPEEVKEKQTPNFPFSQLYYFDNATKNVELLGIDNIDDQEYYKIKITDSNDSDDISYEFYNVSTGLLDFSESYTKDKEDNPITVKMAFNNYEIQGKKKYALLMPTKYTMTTGEQKLDFELKEMIIKKKAKTKAFEGEF